MAREMRIRIHAPNIYTGYTSLSRGKAFINKNRRRNSLALSFRSRTFSPLSPFSPPVPG